MAWNNEIKYRPEMCDQLVALMKDGATVKEVAEAFGVHFTTIYDWKKIYPDFGKAYLYGQQCAENFYTAMGRENLQNKEFNFNLYRLVGRNRFGWTDYRCVQVPGLDKAVKHTEQMDLVKRAVAAGEITPDEALKLASVVVTSAKVMEITDMADRVEALENRLEDV